MADALVSVVLEQLGSMIAQKVEKEVAVTGVKNEVEKLQRNFQAIKDVLADAEQRQLKEEYIKRWMGQLKDVSYDMEDVLDEWSTAIAKSQMKVNDEHPPTTIRKRAVQADALTMDRLASLEKYSETAVKPRESILTTEIEWLNSIKADLVVSDVVPVACRAAADAGIRSVCVTNFS